jgi:hypothetical protein
MRYYLDTEFIERPPSTELLFVADSQTASVDLPPTIELLSLGIVAENGRELYVVSREADLSRANEFVRANVIPNLGHPDAPRPEDPTEHDTSNWRTREGIARLVRAFIAPDPKPVFYGYYADYDWVVFCWLFGTMMDLPKGFPYYCRDLKQTVDEIHETVGIDLRLLLPTNDAHNALVDARFAKKLHEILLAYASGTLDEVGV